MATLTVSPTDEKRVKALGFLSNKGTDNFSGRIITVNGKITAAQQQCIAEAAEKFGNGNITFTTRLTIEVQGIPYDKIEDFRAYIAREGLVTGGTGSLVRPVVACKGTTCQYGLLDSFALSEEIHHRFYEGYHTVRLPHKFKIAVGGCPNNCVKPDLNDLGIIGQRIPNLDPLPRLHIDFLNLHLHRVRNGLALQGGGAGFGDTHSQVPPLHRLLPGNRCSLLPAAVLAGPNRL